MEEKTMKKIRMDAEKDFTAQATFDRYTRKCSVSNLSSKTIGTYQCHFKVFRRFLEAKSVGLQEITLATVEDFILYLKDTRHCKDITINSYLRSLRSFLNFCFEEGAMAMFKTKLIKVDKEIKKTYTDTELKTLLKKPNVKACDFTEYKTWVFSNYLLATGNRISSALNVRVEDIDFDSGVIQVNKTKNRKAQIVPLSSALSNVLREYLVYRKGEGEDFLFCSTCGTQADIRTYQEMLKQYNRGRGVSKTSAHLYRHTFAKKWILNGGDIFRLQKVLGHSDLTMVREYVNMFGNEIAVDFDKYNPLDNLDGRQTREKIRM
jgi:integrase/recombinase XerD